MKLITSAPLAWALVVAGGLLFLLGVFNFIFNFGHIASWGPLMLIEGLTTAYLIRSLVQICRDRREQRNV